MLAEIDALYIVYKKNYEPFQIQISYNVYYCFNLTALTLSN